MHIRGKSRTNETDVITPAVFILQKLHTWQMKALNKVYHVMSSYLQVSPKCGLQNHFKTGVVNFVFQALFRLPEQANRSKITNSCSSTQARARAERFKGLKIDLRQKLTALQLKVQNVPFLLLWISLL